MTGRQLVEKLLAATGVTPPKDTVDNFKYCDPDQPVTGVLTCFVPTMRELKEAVARKINLLIVHEPLFYNHWDNLEWLGEHPIAAEKEKYIKDHKLMIWRFHDITHILRPDLIVLGLQEALGWDAPEYIHHGPTVFTFPETSFQDLARQLKKAMGGTTVRMHGDPSLRCRKLSVCVGSPPTDAMLKSMARKDADVYMIGEGSDWASAAMVDDIVGAGLGNIGVVMAGHRNSENPGVGHVTKYIQKLFPDLRVEFLVGQDSYIVV